MIWSKVLPYVAIAGLGVAVLFQAERIKTKDAELSGLARDNQKLLESVEQLHALQETHTQQITEMMDEQLRVAAAHSKQFEKITRLQNDVEEIRDWAGQPLPDAVVRMRNRATVTGSSAYDPGLSGSEAVPVEGGQPQDERRLEPGT